MGEGALTAHRRKAGGGRRRRWRRHRIGSGVGAGAGGRRVVPAVAGQCRFESGAGAAQSAAGCGAAQPQGRSDLRRGQFLPGRECEDLAVLVGEALESRGNWAGWPIVNARPKLRRGGFNSERLSEPGREFGAAPVPSALIEDHVAGDPEQPRGSRARRYVVEPSPRHEEGLGDDIRRIVGVSCAPQGVPKHRPVVGVEQVLEPVAVGLGCRRHPGRRKSMRRRGIPVNVQRGRWRCTLPVCEAWSAVVGRHAQRTPPRGEDGNAPHA